VYNDIESYTRISVSPEDDIEIRRMTIRNLSSRERTLDLTSYSEVVLSDGLSDISHPVFNSLFIQTELLPDRSAILCTRRPRLEEEKTPWMFKSMVVHNGQPIDGCSFETDRKRFIGRTHSPSNPDAMNSVGHLSNTAGMVLDPIVSIRRRIVVPAWASVMVDIIMGASSTSVASIVKCQVKTGRILRIIFSGANEVLYEYTPNELPKNKLERCLPAAETASCVLPAPESAG
jgi:hypothetical protein